MKIKNSNNKMMIMKKAKMKNLNKLTLRVKNRENQQPKRPANRKAIPKDKMRQKQS